VDKKQIIVLTETDDSHHKLSQKNRVKTFLCKDNNTKEQNLELMSETADNIKVLH